MTVGRKPTPTALKLVTGNPGKRAISKAQRDLARALPPQRPLPPPFLNDDAKVEWGRVIDALYNAGLMTVLDYAALGAYCQAFGRWAEAERALSAMAAKDAVNKAMLVNTKAGNVIQNPLVGIANKAREDMVKFASEFGMTPVSRARVDPVFPTEPSSDAPRATQGDDHFAA